MRGTYKELKSKMFNVEMNILTYSASELYLNEKKKYILIIKIFRGNIALIIKIDLH